MPRSSRRGAKRLVLEHLEGVSRRLLERHQGVIREHAKGKRGIYALYRRDRLYYVGLASNLRSRLRAHLNDRHAKGWDSFSLYVTPSDAHLREMEALVLRITMPRGNRSKTRLPGSSDLRRSLRRRLTARYRLELDQLLGHRIRRRPASADGRHARGDGALVHVVRARLPIRMTYKGVTYEATAHPDGTVRSGGRRHSSLSAAARALTKQPMNGWQCWRYRHRSGDWRRMSTLNS